MRFRRRAPKDTTFTAIEYRFNRAGDAPALDITFDFITWDQQQGYIWNAEITDGNTIIGRVAITDTPEDTQDEALDLLDTFFHGRFLI